ncbi:MAG: DUF480 domain-containing protein [Acidobacteria bacterium]|nr:DUF480 domain-containing protein [Acidobacteriota bacterium]
MSSLTPNECRVLGVLIEKSLAQPAYYPMTLNALRTGANQKSNRSPQMSLDVDQVDATLERLRMLGAVVEVHGDGRGICGVVGCVLPQPGDQRAGERGTVGREERKGRGVMHSNDVRAGDHPARSQVGCVPHVHLAAVQLPGETQVVVEAVRAAVEDEQLEVVRQAAEGGGVGVAADQEVRGGGVQPGQGLHQVAGVGAGAEVTDASNVESDDHGLKPGV